MNLKSRMRRPLAFLLAVPAFLLSACADRQVQALVQAAPRRSWNWIDHQPGCWVRVVAPVIRSDGHLVEGLPVIRQRESQENGRASAQKPGAVTIHPQDGKGFRRLRGFALCGAGAAFRGREGSSQKRDAPQGQEGDGPSAPDRAAIPASQERQLRPHPPPGLGEPRRS